MSFRGGRGAPRGRGGDRGRGGFASRGAPRGRGGGARSFDTGPPAEVLEMGTLVHSVEGEMLCASTSEKIPYFNAPIYLENKSTIGKIDEILGPINEVYFTVKPTEGIQASSFAQGQKVFIGGDKLLPLERFLPKPKGPPGPKAPKKRGGAAGGGRGAPRGRGRGGPPRGGSFGGRGGGRGAPGGRGRGGSSFGRGAPRGAPRGRGRGGY